MHNVSLHIQRLQWLEAYALLFNLNLLYLVPDCFPRKFGFCLDGHQSPSSFDTYFDCDWNMLFQSILATEIIHIMMTKNWKLIIDQLIYFLNEVSGLDESNLEPGMRDQGGNWLEVIQEPADSIPHLLAIPGHGVQSEKLHLIHHLIMIKVGWLMNTNLHSSCPGRSWMIQHFADLLSLETNPIEIQILV